MLLQEAMEAAEGKTRNPSGDARRRRRQSSGTYDKSADNSPAHSAQGHSRVRTTSGSASGTKTTTSRQQATSKPSDKPASTDASKPTVTAGGASGAPSSVAKVAAAAEETKS